MQSPDGLKFPNAGVYLEVVPNERLVLHRRLHRRLVAEGRPALHGRDHHASRTRAGKTRYEARVRHWTAEARVQHETMGFHQGWGQCADQLEALAKTL